MLKRWRAMKFKKSSYWTALWKDDAGQSTTEYILMLSVVVMIAMKFKESFLGKMTGIVDKLGGNIDKVITEP